MHSDLEDDHTKALQKPKRIRIPTFHELILICTSTGPESKKKEPRNVKPAVPVILKVEAHGIKKLEASTVDNGGQMQCIILLGRQPCAVAKKAFGQHQMAVDLELNPI